MSHSETTSAPQELSDRARQVAQLVDVLIEHDATAEVPEDVLRTLVSSVTQLYGIRAEVIGQPSEPLHENVTATEAIELACALLKARDLNPFDLALWFSRSR